MAAASYIFDSREYVLTGRSARKQSRQGSKSLTMVEIRPISNDPADNSDNRWVKMEDLFHVIQDESEVL